MAHVQFLLMLLAGCASLQQAFAHGGGVHAWTYDSDVYASHTDAHLKVATCSDWSRLNVTTAPPGVLPFFPASVNVTINGSVDVYTYLSGNKCTSFNTGFFPMLSFTLEDGTPYTNKASFAFGFVGNCSAPVDIYRHNVTLGDNRFNLLWWNSKEAVINEEGFLWGAAPNSFIVRNATQPQGLGSIILFPEGAPVQCCNIQWQDVPDRIFDLGTNCTGSAAAAGGHRRSKARRMLFGSKARRN